MITLRCTARLLDRLKVKITDPSAITVMAANDHGTDSTTRLGDLYANLLHINRSQLVLGMCERTFLPTLVPAAPSATLVPRLRLGVGEMLRSLHVPSVAIERELAEMDHVVFAKTANRQVMGLMTDFGLALEYYLDGKASLLDVALKLAQTPCSPLFKTTTSPDRATAALFATET